MAMLPPPPTNPITLPWQRDFTWGGKKAEYVKPLTEGREVSYGKIGLTILAVTQDLLSGMPLVRKVELIRIWNSILPELGQPSAQLSKLIRLTACKKDMQSIMQSIDYAGVLKLWNSAQLLMSSHRSLVNGLRGGSDQIRYRLIWFDITIIFS